MRSHAAIPWNRADCRDYPADGIAGVGRRAPEATPGHRPPASAGPRGQFGQQQLLSPAAIEKLKLTDTQKESFTKIETEYKDKAKEMNTKLRDAIKAAGQGGARDALQKIRADQETLRKDSLAKVEALLTPEQKKTFEEVKQQPGRQPGIVPPGGRPGGGNGAGGPIVNRGGQPVGDVLSKPAQDQLKLTDEQKKKIEELQKEVETKINGILTDEQKKQLEELKKAPPARRPGLPIRPNP